MCWEVALFATVGEEQIAHMAVAQRADNWAGATAGKTFRCLPQRPTSASQASSAKR